MYYENNRENSDYLRDLVDVQLLSSDAEKGGGVIGDILGNEGLNLKAWVYHRPEHRLSLDPMIVPGGDWLKRDKIKVCGPNI